MAETENIFQETLDDIKTLLMLEKDDTKTLEAAGADDKDITDSEKSENGEESSWVDDILGLGKLPGTVTFPI